MAKLTTYISINNPAFERCTYTNCIATGTKHVCVYKINFVSNLPTLGFTISTWH